VWEAEEHVTAERFQATTGIARTVLQHGTPHRIGDLRLQFLEAARLAADTMAGDQANKRAARFQSADERWNERGVVLALAVKRHDKCGPRRGNAGANRRRLTARLLMANST